jgi:bifunctional DNA-binding transcriptional regulator/antitoxin component of YhaV-PrlF toxin-antitoxin module
VNEKTWIKKDLLSFTAKLDSKGRISIPSIIRQKYKLDSGIAVSIKIIERGEKI